jgi:hypothetical protein
VNDALLVAVADNVQQLLHESLAVFLTKFVFLLDLVEQLSSLA